MNISLEWLSDFVPGPLDAQRVADALMNGGFPAENIKAAGSDTVLDVEVTSNRGDCLSHLGMAREVGALLDLEVKSPAHQLKESSTGVDSATSVRIEATKLCPHYTARIIRNVKIGPSPQWLVRRLEAVGLRPINNVVDVTNYVMFELGQPLHAFDLDKLAGRKIIVREARGGEKIVSIDGHQRTLTPGMLVIADEQKPVALAGVMGGAESEVSNSTVNVLLESARFDPLSVRRTARALAMKSDSSYRFERGIDPTLPDRASLRAAHLIQEIAGGEVLKGAASAGDGSRPAKSLMLRLKQIRRILGIDIPADQVISALRRVQLSPKQEGDSVVAMVPSWRLDLNIETDLIEEVARVVGYDKVPVRDEISIRIAPPESAQRTMNDIRSILVASGYFEAVTFTFVSDLLADTFVPAHAASLPRADASVRKADARLRPSLIPGLLEAVRRNETVGNSSAKLFEVGSTFFTDSSAKIFETRRLGLVGSGDLHEVRGVVESLLAKLDAKREVKIVPEDAKGFAHGSVARIEWAGKAIGHIGKLDRAVVDRLSLRETPAAAEIDIVPLLAGAQHVPQLRPLPRFPAVRRDLSLVVSEQTRYGQFDALVKKLQPPFLEDLEYVTTYRGKPMEKGSKSITSTLVFRSLSGTLTSEQVEETVQKIIDAAKAELSATLRA